MPNEFTFGRLIFWLYRSFTRFSYTLSRSAAELIQKVANVEFYSHCVVAVAVAAAAVRVYESTISRFTYTHTPCSHTKHVQFQLIETITDESIHTAIALLKIDLLDVVVVVVVVFNIFPSFISCSVFNLVSYGASSIPHFIYIGHFSISFSLRHDV